MSLSILVTNYSLKTYGGSETFTYALIEELCRIGHVVEYFTFEKGLTSARIENELNVSYFSKKKYDVVFANHNTCVEYLRKKIYSSNIIIQTCHGIYPELEQPSGLADSHISISEEVKRHLMSLGIQSEVILNGINTTRFQSKKPTNKTLKKVLSLCQSDSANSEIKNACKKLKLEFHKLNKHIAPIWNVEDKINDVDLVIGLGRSAYEGMACGRPVIIYDHRVYAQSYADGYVDSKMIHKSIENNCSGRYFKRKLSVESLVLELNKYDANSGKFLREFAEQELNIRKQVEKYLIQYKLVNKSSKAKMKHRFYFLKENIFHFINYPILFLKIKKWCHRFAFDEVSSNDLKKIRKTSWENKLYKKGIIEEINQLNKQKKKDRLAIWNNFLEITLPKKQGNPKLTIAKNPNLTAVIVEARKHPHFKVVVQNVIKNTQHLNTGLIVFHGTENENFVKDALKEYDHINYINLNVENLDIEDYNKIMLSKEFHKYITTDKFLVFQTDTITFKPLDKKFLEYDYIGAPWKKEFHQQYKAEVGNGGLSLRSKAAMLSILDLNIIRKPYTPEDLYLAQILKEKNYNLPNYNLAKEFSTEDVLSFNSFGCHKSWELIKTIDLKVLLNQAI